MFNIYGKGMRTHEGIFHATKRAKHEKSPCVNTHATVFEMSRDVAKVEVNSTFATSRAANLTV